MLASCVSLPPEWNRPLCWFVVSCCVVCLLLGCNKEQVEEISSKVKDQIAKAPEMAREVLPSTGRVTLQLDRSVDIPRAEGDLFVSGGSRPAVLQIRSYSKGDRASLPAVFIHAPVQARMPSDLVGKVIEAQMFLRYDNDQDIWSNRDDEVVKLMVQSYADNEMVCQILSGVLVSPSGITKPVSGDIRLQISPNDR